MKAPLPSLESRARGTPDAPLNRGCWGEGSERRGRIVGANKLWFGGHRRRHHACIMEWSGTGRDVLLRSLQLDWGGGEAGSGEGCAYYNVCTLTLDKQNMMRAGSRARAHVHALVSKQIVLCCVVYVGRKVWGERVHGGTPDRSSPAGLLHTSCPHLSLHIGLRA